MSVNTTSVHSAEESNLPLTPEEEALREKSLKSIREWNKTLKMSIIKRSGPWKLDELPPQYCPPAPSRRQHHTPPVFIFGIPLTEEDILEINRKLGTYDEYMKISGFTRYHCLNRAVRLHAEKVCEIEKLKYKRMVEWRVYYSKEENSPVPLFLCIARTYDHCGFRDLRKLASKFSEAFPYLNKQPMWYLDALENDLEEEDWTITGIPGL